MNNILKVSLIVIAVLAIAGGLFFAGSMFGSFWLQRSFAGSADPAIGAAVNPGGNQNAPIPNNGQGAQGNNQGPQGGPGNQGFQGNPNDQGGQDFQGNPNDQGSQGFQDGQGGQPGGRNDRGGMPNQGRMPGRGGMGQGQGGGPGMGGMPGQNRNQENLTPLTVDEAKKAAQDYVTALKIDGLELGEVLIFDTHAYVVVKETATGNGAFELVVDPVNKLAYPEPGPDTLWNLKYGGVLQAGMPGMMGHFGPGPKGPGQAADATPNPTPDAAATAAPAATPANVSAEMPISQDYALKAAQTYLDTAAPGATAATEALKFYGYYTVKFSKDGELVGMLSVNGYNGQVIGRPWRGSLIEQPQ